MGRAAFSAALVLVSAGCVVVPRTTQIYDPECQVMANRMVLQEVQIAAIAHCANQGCEAMVLTAGLVGAASVVISGTIVIAGNVAYWLERRANCVPVTAPKAP